MFRCIYSFNSTHHVPVTACAFHDELPLIAVASSNQFLRLMDLEGNIRNHINDYTCGPRAHHKIGLVNTLSFHRYLPQLAIGAETSLVSLFAPS
jgi:WD40 repeat protein